MAISFDVYKQGKNGAQNNYTNYGDVKTSLTPKPAMSFDDFKKSQNITDDNGGMFGWAGKAVGSALGGIKTFGSEVLHGAGDIAGGLVGTVQGVGQGLGDIATKGYATQQPVDTMIGGMRQAVGGAIRTGFAPYTATVSALPSQVGEGFNQIGKAVTGAIDYAPKLVGGGVSMLGEAAHNKDLQNVGSRISASAASPEWQQVNSDLQNAVAMATIAKVPMVPEKISYAVNAPTEFVANKVLKPAYQKAIAPLVKGVGNTATTFGKELMTKISNLTPEMAAKTKELATTNEHFIPALQNKITKPQIVNNALDSLQKIQNETLRMNKSVQSNLANLKDANGKPLVVKVDRSQIPGALSEHGLTLTPDMKIQPQGGKWNATGLTPAQAKSFEPIIQEMMGSKQLKPVEFWNTRKKTGAILNKLKTDGQYTSAAQQFADSLYNSWNNAARAKIPGLEAQDSIIKAKNDIVKPFADKLFDKNGDLVPGAEQIVEKFGNNNPQAKAQLAALEKVHPGITKQFDAVNTANEIMRQGGNVPGNYVRAGISGIAAPAALASLASGNIPAAIGLGAMGAVTNPINIAKTIATVAKKGSELSTKYAPALSKAKNIAKQASTMIQESQPWELPGKILSKTKK